MNSVLPPNIHSLIYFKNFTLSTAVYTTNLSAYLKKYFFFCICIINKNKHFIKYIVNAILISYCV